MAKATKKSPQSAQKPTTGAKPEKNKKPAAKKKETRKWSAFVLSDNTVHAVSGVKVAKLYEEDNTEMIKEKQTFALKKDMTDWIANRTLQLKGNISKPKQGQLPGSTVAKAFDVDDQAKIDAALREIDAKRPADKLEVHCRTSSQSKAVAIVFRFINIQGKDAWNVKPESICLSISTWTVVFKQECPIIAHALANLRHLRMRDPAGDMHSVAQKKWTSPVTKEERSFDTYVATTHFIMPPLEELETEEQETHYIFNKCKQLGDLILYIIQQPTFTKCYQRAINHDKIWRAVSGETSKMPGNSYIDFVAGARVVVLRCPNFNTHVVKEDAAELGKILRNNTYKTAKYPPDEDDLKDTDDEGDEGDDDDEEESTIARDDPDTKEKPEAPKTPPTNRNLDAEMEGVNDLENQSEADPNAKDEDEQSNADPNAKADDEQTTDTEE